MRFLHVVLVLSVFQIGTVISGEGWYKVIAPAIIFANEDYNVALSVHQHTTAPVILKVSIEGEHFKESKELKFSIKNDIQLLRFHMAELPELFYSLTVEGLAGLHFKNSTKLLKQIDRPYAKILTDKQRYKQGETLKFRVFFLDWQQKPITPTNPRIWIDDTGIKHIKDYVVIIEHGSFAAELELSKDFALGIYSICVTADSMSDSVAYFEVYSVQPAKYFIHIDVAEDVYYGNKKFPIVLHAKNNRDGTLLNGQVELFVDFAAAYEADEAESQLAALKDPATIRKTTRMIAGTAQFSIDLQGYEPWISLKATATHQLYLHAIIHEDKTEQRLEIWQKTNLYGNRYKFQKEPHFSSYIPNVEQEFYFSIKAYDDKSPVNNTEMLQARLFITENSINQTANASLRNMEYVYESLVRTTEQVMFKVLLPALEQVGCEKHDFSMYLQYDGQKSYVGQVEQSIMSNNEYFFLSGGVPKVGEEFVVNLHASQPLTHFFYAIVGRGHILLTERIDLPESQSAYVLKLIPTTLMAPTLGIYVYYIGADGRYHYAERMWDVEFVLPNQIELQIPEVAKPADNITFTVKTSPNSYVGLIAIDHKEQVGLGLQSFFTPTFHTHRTQTFELHGFTHYPGDIVGLLTLTTANYVRNKQSSTLIATHMSNCEPSSADQVLPLRREIYSDQFRYPTSYDRQYKFSAAPIADTWMFESLKSSEVGFASWTTQVPNAETTWVVSAYVISADLGLGLTSHSQKLSVYS